MLTDCNWLLANLAEGLQRFAMMDDEMFFAYVRIENGLFHAIGNGVVNSPYVLLVDDGRVDWGADRLTEITTELRMVGQLRAGENLRVELEKLLSEVIALQGIVVTSQ